MFNYTDVLAHLERRNDLLREVENERLVKIALSALRARKAEKKAKTQQSERPKTEDVACCETATVSREIHSAANN
ncbi:MAG: hypothetical protein DCC59_12060 [Chloroflexi bacterium]|nr:hypothetical protein [Chloroflexi bacterium CFX1]MCK6568611.1 hypothetical protein [Anaerolineales bacterium]MCQ3954250.1 hypothetical protein [Chloroflexota bacterium]MDL1920761.1 hypothetical protein [Chloroflexi bacterium CFX5]NUQ60308.1 hypothetical protein [Anaerolineales bacterium]